MKAVGVLMRRYRRRTAGAALAVSAALVGVFLASPALGGKWPKPAAGPSGSGGPELVLTFDDGPHEDYTPIILDELDRRGLKAVFFWVGHRISGERAQVDDRRALVHRAMNDGMLIGNHTINHAQLCAGDRRNAAREIDENRRLYEELTGMPVHWFRAPYGAKCNRLVAMLQQRRLQHFHWDMDPKEWEHRDSNETFDYVTRKLQKLEGRGVLIMHDTKRASVRALPRILDWIERENKRRKRRDEAPIRIVSFVDLARERLPAGSETLGRELANTSAALGQQLRALVPDLRSPRM